MSYHISSENKLRSHPGADSFQTYSQHQLLQRNHGKVKNLRIRCCLLPIKDIPPKLPFDTTSRPPAGTVRLHTPSPTIREAWLQLYDCKYLYIYIYVYIYIYITCVSDITYTPYCIPTLYCLLLVVIYHDARPM